jgi:hypothetical protein
MWLFGISTVVLLVWLAGCAGKPQLLPNRDSSLNKTAAQFAADAARRHPYKSDAPRGGEIAGRAQVGYWSDTLEITNLSDTDWDDFEVWVNKKYVIHVDHLAKPIAGSPNLVRFTFYMLFDDAGNSFPTDNRKTLVDSVEIYKDGKMYDMKKQQAD